MANSDSSWDQRILCNDGNCIGIIGADGRCKICGLPYDGDLFPSMADSAVVDDDGDGSAADQPMTADDDFADDDPADDDSQIGPDESEDSWENRILCVDESCIGVVGPDGRCKVCGKRYPG